MASSNYNPTDVFHRGRLRFSATFRNPDVEIDPAGGRINIYRDVLTTRCQLIKTLGSEVLGSGQLYYNEDYTMRCGYRGTMNLGGTDPINTDTIVVIRGPGLPSTVFKIVTWAMVDMVEHIFEFKLSVSK